MKDDSKRTALHSAAEHDKTSALKVLLEYKSDLEEKDKQGHTSLALASHRGHAKSVQILLEYQANVNTMDNLGQRPLHLAASEDHEQAMQCLIEHGADIEARTFKRRTPLLAAVIKGRRDAVRFLANQGANLMAKEVNDSTALHLAVYADDKALVRFLLNRGLDIEAKTVSGLTALSRAAVLGRAEILTILLESGADVASTAKDSWTPLHYAAHHGHETATDLLLQHGADVTATSKYGSTPQMVADNQGHSTVAKMLAERVPVSKKGQEQSKSHAVALFVAAVGKGNTIQMTRLIKEGVEIDTMDLNGRRAVSAAAENNQEAAMNLLIAGGAGINMVDATGESALWWASRYGHAKLVTQLLREAAHVESPDCDGQTPLCVASQKGHVNVVSLLLKHGSDPNSSVSYGKTPMLFAASKGHVEVVKLLLRAGVDPNYASPKDETALSLAEDNGHEEVAKLLKERGGFRNLSSRDAQYSRDLLEASQAGRVAEIRRLLDLGINVNEAINAKPPIVAAAQHGQVAALQILLERGAEVDKVDSSGLTAMSYAAGWGHRSIIKILKERGSKIDQQCNVKRTPLSYAAGYGHKNAVETLLELGAMKEIKDQQSKTALWYASHQGDKDIVKILLDHGANIEAADSSGYTPLTLAVHEGNRALADLLLKHGAQMRPESITNCSPLCLAADVGAEGLVDLLIDRGANLNHLSDNRETPLIISATNGHNMVVKMLIEAGADVNQQDDNGRTALSYAKEEGHEAVIGLITRAVTLRNTNERAIKKAEQEGLIRRKLYQYRPLLQKSYIRALELHPGQANDIISFELVDIDLKKNPPFEALSYEWKDKTGTVPVQCNQDRLLVTPNCKAALKELRLESGTRTLWIDAVCINQSDKEEVNQQVAMMTDIYRKASTVLMWLGEEESNTEAAFESLTGFSEVHDALLKDSKGSCMDLHKLEDREDVQEYGQGILEKPGVAEGLRDLYWRPYFTRAWIFQEIILAGARGLVMCGKHHYSWKDFKKAMLGYEVCNESSNPALYQVVQSDETFAREGGLELGPAIVAMSVLEATDPRDKIFATLRLSVDRQASVQRPIADYTLTVQQVYVNAARYFTDYYEGVEMWHLGNRNSTKTVKDLPTWVPDFVKRWDENPFANGELDFQHLIKGRPTTTPESLHIDGCLLDKLAFKVTIEEGKDAFEIVKLIVLALARLGKSIYHPTLDSANDTRTKRQVPLKLKGRRSSKVRFQKSTKRQPPTSTRIETPGDTKGQAMMGVLFEEWGKDLEEDTRFATYLIWKMSKDERVPASVRKVPPYLNHSVSGWEAESRLRKDFDLEICKNMENRLRYGRDLVYTEQGYFGLTNQDEAEEEMVIALLGGDSHLGLLKEMNNGHETWYEYVDRVFLGHLTKDIQVQALDQLDKNARIERLELR